MARILVIEDEPSLQKVLDFNLRQSGHESLSAMNGAAGLELARTARPDLVLLDWMLPDLPGTDVCRTLKLSPSTRSIPVIFLTARGDEIDRIVGFELGAADYVVKPFSVRELMLRIQAVLRRSETSVVQGKTTAYGLLKVDEDAHRVWVDGQETSLTLLEFKLLRAFCSSRDRVQSRASLLEGVWGLDVNITTRTVDTHVKRLRDKLGKAGDYIQTVRGIGYRFTTTPGLDDDE